MSNESFTRQIINKKKIEVIEFEARVSMYSTVGEGNTEISGIRESAFMKATI